MSETRTLYVTALFQIRLRCWQQNKMTAMGLVTGLRQQDIYFLIRIKQQDTIGINYNQTTGHYWPYLETCNRTQ